MDLLPEPVELPVRVGLVPPLPLLGWRLTGGRSRGVSWRPPPECDEPPPDWLERVREAVVELLVIEDDEDEELELLEEEVEEALVLPSTELVAVEVVSEGASPLGGLTGGVMRGSAASEPLEAPSVAAVTPPPASTDSAKRRSQRRGPLGPSLPISSLIVFSSIVSGPQRRTIAR